MIKKTTLLFLSFLIISTINAQSMEDQAVIWLKEFIKIDTINPPGNEFRAVD